MLKFGRNYELSVQQQNGEYRTVTLPFTLEFDITRNIYSSANVASFRVLNLNMNTRNEIRKNAYNSGDLRNITLRAGYGTNLPIIFTGNLFQAWSVREGDNFATQMESLDGGFAFENGVTSNQFPAETPQSVIFETLLNNLPGVTIGAIGATSGSTSRGNTYNGSTTGILREVTGGGFFIDNGKANILGNNECLQGSLEVLSPGNGLLGTPVLEQTILNVDVLFEPRLIVGQKVYLDTVTDPTYQGYYKIISLKHRGTISAAVGGDAVTSVGLFAGPEALSIVGEL